MVDIFVIQKQDGTPLVALAMGRSGELVKTQFLTKDESIDFRLAAMFILGMAAGDIEKARTYAPNVGAALVGPLKGAERQAYQELNNRATQELKKSKVEEPKPEETRTEATVLTTKQRQMLANMEQYLAQRVLGQDDAIAAACNIVRSNVVGFKDEGKPLGVLFFAGPSGVGKSELCKALAEFLSELFDGECPLKSFDMVNYKEAHTVSSLVGSPPGYVNSDEGGALTNAIGESPRCVILLDEFDKAHPDVTNLLLPAFDEARLTSRTGETFDCGEVLFVASSNYNSSNIELGKPHMGFGKGVHDYSSVVAKVQEGVREHLRPELRGRIDEIIVFRPLERETLMSIARGKLQSEIEKSRRNGLAVRFDEGAIDVIVDSRRDPLDGARHLDKEINRLVHPLLVDYLLKTDPNKLKPMVIEANGEGTLSMHVEPLVVRAPKPKPAPKATSKALA